MATDSFSAILNYAGVLVVRGAEQADRLLFRQTDNKISIKGVSGSWSATKVKSIDVNLRGGDDYVSFNSLANGGQQTIQEPIVVRSGAGNERVRLANLRDVYFSGSGHTLAISAGGTPTLDGRALSNFYAALSSAGVLTVHGSDSDDKIFLRQCDAKISVKGVSGSWSSAKVTSIVVRFKAGNDYVSLNSCANGGNQELREDITVLSGYGDERVRLADGTDVYFSGVGPRLLVSAAGAVTLPLPTMPDSDEYYGTFVSASSYIEAYWDNVPNVAGLITDLSNSPVVLPLTYEEARDRWFETYERLQRDTQLLVGTYHSFRDAQAAPDMTVTFPPRAVPLEDLDPDQILVKLTPEDFDGEAYCDVYVVDYRQPEARAYLIDRIVQDVLATGANLAYLDNVGHPASGGPVSALTWESTMDCLHEIVDRLHRHGVRVMINVSLAMGWDEARIDADLDQLIATGVDGTSWEMSYREDARTNVEWTRALMNHYGKLLNADQTVAFLPRVDRDAPATDRQAEAQMLAAFGLMFREPGDGLFVSTSFWQAQPEWVNWTKTFGDSLAAADVALNSEGQVVIERHFENAVLRLNAVTRDVQILPPAAV